MDFKHNSYGSAGGGGSGLGPVTESIGKYTEKEKELLAMWAGMAMQGLLCTGLPLKDRVEDSFRLAESMLEEYRARINQ